MSEITVRIFAEDGAWRYDVQDEAPPRQRRTGNAASRERAIEYVIEELEHIQSMMRV